MRFRVSMDSHVGNAGPEHWGHGGTLPEAIKSLMRQVVANGTDEQMDALDESMTILEVTALMSAVVIGHGQPGNGT